MSLRPFLQLVASARGQRGLAVLDWALAGLLIGWAVAAQSLLWLTLGLLAAALAYWAPAARIARAAPRIRRREPAAGRDAAGDPA